MGLHLYAVLWRVFALNIPSWYNESELVWNYIDNCFSSWPKTKKPQSSETSSSKQLHVYWKTTEMRSFKRIFYGEVNELDFYFRSTNNIFLYFIACIKTLFKTALFTYIAFWRFQLMKSLYEVYLRNKNFQWTRLCLHIHVSWCMQPWHAIPPTGDKYSCMSA